MQQKAEMKELIPRGDHAPSITPTQIGILKDIAANKIDLDEIGDWLREQLVQIIFHEGPLLIDSNGPAVFLTAAGKKFLAQGHRQAIGTQP